jgi:hypothetical protein
MSFQIKHCKKLLWKGQHLVLAFSEKLTFSKRITVQYRNKKEHRRLSFSLKITRVERKNEEA